MFFERKSENTTLKHVGAYIGLVLRHFWCGKLWYSGPLEIPNFDTYALLTYQSVVLLSFLCAKFSHSAQNSRTWLERPKNVP